MRPLLAVTTAAAALALSACGGDGSSDAGASSARDRVQDGALKFAECMRENGVDMPDPQVSGNGMVRIAPREGSGGRAPFEGDSAKVEAAHEKCRKHLEAGMGERSPKQRAEMHDAMVKFAECMRGEGIDMPDPEAGGGGFRVRRGDPGGLDPESPKFQAAHEVCEKHLAGVGPRAERTSP